MGHRAYIRKLSSIPLERHLDLTPTFSIVFEWWRLLGSKRDLVVVDDRSTDGTAKDLRGLSIDGLMCLFHDRNHGKGTDLAPHRHRQPLQGVQTCSKRSVSRRTASASNLRSLARSLASATGLTRLEGVGRGEWRPRQAGRELLSSKSDDFRSDVHLREQGARDPPAGLPPGEESWKSALFVFPGRSLAVRHPPHYYGNYEVRWL